MHKKDVLGPCPVTGYQAQSFPRRIWFMIQHLYVNPAVHDSDGVSDMEGNGLEQVLHTSLNR